MSDLPCDHVLLELGFGPQTPFIILSGRRRGGLAPARDGRIATLEAGR